MKKVVGDRRAGIDEKDRRHRQAVQGRVGNKQRGGRGRRKPPDARAQAHHHGDLCDEQDPDAEWVTEDQLQQPLRLGGVGRHRAGDQQAGGHPGVDLADNAALAQLGIGADDRRRHIGHGWASFYVLEQYFTMIRRWVRQLYSNRAVRQSATFDDVEAPITGLDRRSSPSQYWPSRSYRRSCGPGCAAAPRSRRTRPQLCRAAARTDRWGAHARQPAGSRRTSESRPTAQ